MHSNKTEHKFHTLSYPIKLWCELYDKLDYFLLADRSLGTTKLQPDFVVVPVLVNPALQFNYNKISRLVLSKLSGIQRINKSVYAFTCTFAKIRFQKRKQKGSKKRIQKESDQ